MTLKKFCFLTKLNELSNTFPGMARDNYWNWSVWIEKSRCFWKDRIFEVGLFQEYGSIKVYICCFAKDSLIENLRLRWKVVPNKVCC